MASFKVKLNFRGRDITASYDDGKLSFDDKEFEKHFIDMMPLVNYEMPLPVGETQGVTLDDPEGLYAAFIDFYKAEDIISPSDDMFHYDSNVVY
ncbi:hypothetical protein [Companilactobacillus baiquanensis]|uniref:Uncharacterized protein n=1 Tax=Companilactobacillus baiquanensis TaxID=2486005 RepID=A0ABW1UYF9_9LACO|nr:hypothetical protein [Companilactobacillus baiquanensis]